MRNILVLAATLAMVACGELPERCEDNDRGCGKADESKSPSRFQGSGGDEKPVIPRGGGTGSGNTGNSGGGSGSGSGDGGSGGDGTTGNPGNGKDKGRAGENPNGKGGWGNGDKGISE